SEYYLLQFSACANTLQNHFNSWKQSEQMLLLYERVLGHLSKHKAQINVLFKLLHFQPDNESYLSQLSLITKATGLREYLFDKCDSVSETDYMQAWPYLAKAPFYERYNDETYHAAIKNYDALIATDPENWNYYFQKGEFIYLSITSRALDDDFRATRRKVAISALEKSLELNPDHFYTYNYLNRITMWSNSTECKRYRKMAIAAMHKKAHRNKPNPQYYFELAEAYDLPLNGYGSSSLTKDSVLKYYNLALIHGMDSSTIIAERRHVYAALHNYEASNKDHYWMANHTTNAKSKIHYYYAIANNYSAMKQPAKAKEMLLKIKELDPNEQSISRRLREVEKELK
ncbi:MAG: hypothetical protein KDC92_16380, partial [Bacteroidetes bacterium]|nr:hypothetical protein [Bacteroidota bacterium]